MIGSGFYKGEVHFEITKHIGVLSIYSTGWRKELNLVAWNDHQPKYDIRDWSPDHEHMSRGITLHEREAADLLKLLAGEFVNHKQFEMMIML